MVIVIRSSHLEIHVFRYDWLVERDEFELAVPILEQPDDSWLFGSVTL